ncbi:hypothetical protein J3R83DRAFT_711 [Lanmaoa asiatica]|nr:hypothetical protein J3R83DRAFT_711 [Lanmaoa asiatica]
MRMYVTPSTESLLIWDAVLFVHKGEWWEFRVEEATSINSRVLSRQLRRLRSQVCHDVSRQLSGSTPYGALRDGRVPPTCCESDRDVQLDGAVSTLEADNVLAPRRPKEHHVHDILYFVKTAFKERALEKLNELDVVNKEAFKYTENRSSFATLAQQSSQLSQSPSTLYDVPSSRKAYSFRFAPTEPEQVNKVLGTLSIQTPSGHLS